MWVYQQSTGYLWGPKHTLVAIGYSGIDIGKNEPKRQDSECGPLPRGPWVVGEPSVGDTLGPLVVPLYPHRHKACQRKDFCVHYENNREEQKNALVFMRAIVKQIAESGDRTILVVE